MEHVEVLRHMKETIRAIMPSEVAALDAAIASLSAPKPEGEWVLVPREPTPEMLSAAGRLQACECGFIGDMSPMDGEEYAAMLAAAPQPPAEAQPCGCGEATCTVPWEPGCGLGKSEQHAEAQPVGVEGVRRYLAARDAKPIRGIDPDVIHAIHAGTEWEAELRVSDLRALAQQPAPVAPVGVEDESVRVGNLPTMNQDGYPGLGEWWVQLWRGDEIIARVYGDGPDEVRSQAQDIADALNQQPAAVDEADKEGQA